MYSAANLVSANLFQKVALFPLTFREESFCSARHARAAAPGLASFLSSVQLHLKNYNILTNPEVHILKCCVSLGQFYEIISATVGHFGTKAVSKAVPNMMI